MKFSICCLLLFVLFSFQIISKEKEVALSFGTTNPVLTVFENKCNACHLKRKRIVFQKENILKNAPKIYEQVFVKERMPKGRKNQLTPEEVQILKNWLIEAGLDFF